MERKRVAGRFAAEDKGGVIRERAVPRPGRSIQQAEVVTRPGGLNQKDSPRKSERQAKSLLRLLLESVRKGLHKATPAANEGPATIRTDS